MTAIAISGDPMTEVLSPGPYPRREFSTDLSAVQRAVKARETVIERVRAWDTTNSIDVARRLARMRTEGEDYWRGPGMKGNDREFCDWLVTEGEVTSATWARDQLMAGRALPMLESGKSEISLFPVGASQIIRLGSSWYLDRPQAIVNVWLAAVEEAGGQPPMDLVASKARRYKADRQSVEEGKDDAGRRDISRKLKAIRKRLVELHQQDPAYVEAFLRDLSTTIRADAREAAS